MPGNGPFYFAWITSGASPTFGPEHYVEDELIASFDYKHAEGKFATLDIVVVNPRTGPLAPGRKQWAWFSKRQGGSDGPVEPIGLFRLTAMPTNMLSNLVTFSFQAEPVDYQAQKRALADSLRVLPYYDPLFVAENQQDDPDAVLEAYSAVLHIDPVTHVVSISDVLVGEDGTANFGGDDAFYDGADLRVDRPPVNAVTLKGSFPWSQQGAGIIDFGTRTFATADGKGLANSWPKTGDGLAGGYYVAEASAFDQNGLASADPINISVSWQNRAKTHRDGDTMSLQESFSGPAGTNAGAKFGVLLRQSGGGTIADPATGTPASSNFSASGIIVQSSFVTTTLKLGIGAQNDRQDKIQFTMTSDIQAVLRDPESEGDETSEIIDLPTNDASQAEIAIGDAGRGEYISTDRGRDSIRNMFLRGRARLRIGARVARAIWRCRFDDAMDLSLRKNGFIENPRFPGGQAIGKIVEYSLTGSGETGSFFGTVNIGCAVGKGTAITVSDGTPDYVEEDYVDITYQTYTGFVEALDTGDVGIGLPVLLDGGGGFTFPLTKADVVVREELMVEEPELTNAWQTTVRAFPVIQTNASGLTDTYAKLYEERIRNVMKTLAETQTWLELELVDLTKNGIEAFWGLDGLTPLVIPRQIDFEAV